MQVETDSASRLQPHAGEVRQGGLDVAETKRFLAMLDGETDEFLFAVGDDNKERQKRLIAEAKAEGKPKPTLWRHRRGTVLKERRWIEEQQENGRGVFVSVQAMKATKCRIDNLTYIRAVFAEMDIGEPLKPWPMRPSIIAETSPGRSHAYWLVLPDEPITADDFHGVMMCLVETYGSDPDAKDLARRLRMPGTWNLKPGRPPNRVRIIDAGGARYSRTELLDAFPPPPRPKPAASAARPKYNGRTPPGLERFVGKIGDGPIWSISPDRYGDWLRVGMALHAETGGGSDGLALWDRWSAASGGDKWAADVCEAKWKSFGGRRGITGGTIFGMARDSGWVERKAPPGAKAGTYTNGHTPKPTSDGSPDPVPLPSGLLSVASFDCEMLPENVRGRVEDIAERMQCPPDYVGASMMVALGSVIGRKVSVRPKLQDDWSEVANQWGLIIGAPGLLKTPAQGEALSSLRALEATAREAFSLAKADYDAAIAIAELKAKASKDEAKNRLAKEKTADVADLLRHEAIAAPVCKRYITINATTEALGEILKNNPNGVVNVRDEMMALLHKLDEEGQSEARGFYLQAWSGVTDYNFDRIGRGLDNYIPAVCLSMVGGTQAHQQAAVKRCKTCRLDKPLPSFSQHRSSRDGHRHACKACVKKGLAAAKPRTEEQARKAKERNAEPERRVRNRQAVIRRASPCVRTGSHGSPVLLGHSRSPVSPTPTISRPDCVSMSPMG